jgi:predicted RNA-binding Zn ribbon-like protein
MDESEDPRRIERQIEQASRIASRLNDPTTVERLTAWAQALRERLRRILDSRRTKQEIRTRAHELWEQNGRPVGRDLEFWIQAEKEVKERPAPE